MLTSVSFNRLQTFLSCFSTSFGSRPAFSKLAPVIVNLKSTLAATAAMSLSVVRGRNNIYQCYGLNTNPTTNTIYSLLGGIYLIPLFGVKLQASTLRSVWALKVSMLPYFNKQDGLNPVKLFYCTINFGYLGPYLVHS